MSSILIKDVIDGKVLIDEGNRDIDMFSIYRSFERTMCDDENLFEVYETILKDDKERQEEILKLLKEYEIMTVRVVLAAQEEQHIEVTVLPIGDYERYVRFEYSQDDLTGLRIREVLLFKIGEDESGITLLDENGKKFKVDRDGDTLLFNKGVPDTEACKQSEPIFKIDESVDEKKIEYIKGRMRHVLNGFSNTLYHSVKDYLTEQQNDELSPLQKVLNVIE